ncbi:class I SAM-dependent methyltransferase [Calothrix sp. NIES-3974]|uniref:class I SAM-dependent methyltransferase n=1 Tax=Calothrix sp. NIES-3974 TaxID=2005462 RepID=UPI000B5E762A|nr:methyltransferase domain-containing protein [Calothrix sp. NIES-3974]BAZ07810.1 type 11 methyltransferase [Calothrix sp. NIES-3974]
MPTSVNTTTYKQQIIKDFNSRTNYDNGRFHVSVGQRLVELVNLQPGQSILDMATGTGNVTIAAAKIVGAQGRVIGVDMSVGMLQTAREKLFKLGLTNVEFIEADVEEISEEQQQNYWTENSFDMVFCSLAVAYLADIPKFLRQCHRLLKPGGTLAFNAWEEKAFPPSIIFREVAASYGVEIPNPNELLGSPQKCYAHVYQSGFQDIKIICEDFGWYFTPTLEYAEGMWQINSQNAFGYQVNFLSEVKIQECKSKYIEAIQGIETSANQAWCNALLNFVIARKI